LGCFGVRNADKRHLSPNNPPRLAAAKPLLQWCFSRVGPEHADQFTVYKKEPARPDIPISQLKSVDIQLLNDPGCFGEFTVMRATSPPQSIVVFSSSVPQKM
jgi:hypothetical protein